MAIMNFSFTALKNLFSKPATANYPEVPREYPERSRGHVEINIDDCIMCGICSRKCMSGAITIDRANKTWSIERMGCVQCSACVNACPKKWFPVILLRQQKKRLIHIISLFRRLSRAKSQMICQSVFSAVSVQESVRRNVLLLTEQVKKPGQLTVINVYSAVLV